MWVCVGGMAIEQAPQRSWRMGSPGKCEGYSGLKPFLAKYSNAMFKDILHNNVFVGWTIKMINKCKNIQHTYSSQSLMKC